MKMILLVLITVTLLESFFSISHLHVIELSLIFSESRWRRGLQLSR